MKRWVISSSIVILLILGLVISLKILGRSELAVFQDTTTGVILSYPASLSLQKITDQDKADSIIFRAQQEYGQEKAFLITLRYEDGLRTASQLAKKEPLDLVLNGAERAFPLRFPEYKKLSVTRLTHSGKQGAEINFEYRGYSKEIIHQRLLVLMRNDDMAVYLAAQAKKEDFKQMQKNFNQIFKTMRFTE